MANKSTSSVPKKVTEGGTPVSIEIRGAKGPNAMTINGIYEPINDSCNNWPVYRKRGDSNKWLEFFTASNKWYIKATPDRGKARGWMRLSATPPLRPELCSSVCEVWDGSQWISQPAVSIVSLKQRKEEDKRLGSERRAQSFPVDIRGAAGQSAMSINGVYEVTNEISGGWPVYKKTGDPDKWLEYIVATNEWYVKPTTDRGRAEGWMCIPCDNPTRPELCKSTPEVWDGEKWVVQDSVLVLKAVNSFQSMLEFKIFCEEEMLNMEERLYGTLKRTVELLSVPSEKVEEGNVQLNQMMEATRERFAKLKSEIDEQAQSLAAAVELASSESTEDSPPPPPTTIKGDYLID